MGDREQVVVGEKVVGMSLREQGQRGFASVGQRASGHEGVVEPLRMW